MSVIYIVQLESVPVLIMASEHLTAAPYHWFTFLIILNIFCAADIVISFFCGYYDEANQKIVLEASAVAKKYICSYFFFDLISVLQINHIAAYTGWFEQKGFYNAQWVFRFARIKTILNYSDEYRIRWNIPTYIFRTAAYINIWIIFFLWVLYLIIIVRYSDTDEPVDNSFHTIMIMVLEMVQTIFLVRVPRSVSEEPWYKMLVYLLLLFTGLFLNMFIAAQILQIYTCRNISKNKYSHLMNQIEAYTRFKQVPHEVSNRIKSYIQFKFQKTVFKEKLILETISNSLRNEIVWHLCQNFITRVEIFKDMPPNVMMKIVMLLKQEIYLPNDVVVQTGELGTEMFFIYVGVLAVYTPTGKEICHLTDGDHFGEIALLLNETRVASCVAIDFCELYRLTKRDFNEALESYPAAKMRIIQLGQDRFKQTEKIIQGTTVEHSDGELDD
ncbi:potassium/sodium hyperpolarization-activated cyclic nucleotide-gated channel 2-like isoform X2 [Coccinella septempunctata]|nr:potassium/sodium hyperpolarization-activated cyclic nucleotide-gated channel 2-like isoform X2 [Coccinella septempunctata]